MPIGAGIGAVILFILLQRWRQPRVQTGDTPTTPAPLSAESAAERMDFAVRRGAQARRTGSGGQGSRRTGMARHRDRSGTVRQRRTGAGRRAPAAGRQGGVARDQAGRTPAARKRASRAWPAKARWLARSFSGAGHSATVRFEPSGTKTGS